jgi:hydroxymethylbilane synthase
VETVVIRTTGDTVQNRTLADIGGKGLFTKEIDEALLDGRIDVAVHSMKDLPTELPQGLALAAVLPREDPRDVLLLRPGLATSGLGAGGDVFDLLPIGATVGTASLRRGAQMLARRPDLRVVPMRGNVGTRLDKLGRGEADATLLAFAGLRRLGLSPAGMIVLSETAMLPAVAQGAIGVVVRDGAEALAQGLDDPASARCVAAERGFLAALDGSCRTPIAGLATEAADGRFSLDGMVATPDGRSLRRRTWIADSDVADRPDLAACTAFGAACGRALAGEIVR